MPKKVCFHVGFPKTGTTTIQQYLRNQDDKLRSLGFLYPGRREHDVMDAWVNHPWMFNSMVGEAKAPSEGLGVAACREVVARVFEEFRQSDLENLIWSHEVMATNAREWDVNYLERLLDGVDVRIVFFARFVDDWVESRFKQDIWARTGRRAEELYVRPLRQAAPLSGEHKDTAARTGVSMLGQGAMMIEALRIMRKILPSAEIVGGSFDTSREEGKVVSAALASMGVPVEGAFPDADVEAGVENPTKSDLYSMLLYHLITAQAGLDVIGDVAAAAKKRDRRGLKFEPLAGRRFRFLSDENILQARGYYEELREDYPALPVQPPFVSRPADMRLPRDEGVALLEWLRPDISNDIFEKARAAYPADLRG
jgi:hypothetical protein